MSIDTYFCLCCLSTNDLTSVFIFDTEFPETNYENILEDLFAIKLTQDEYEDDSYVCQQCTETLKSAYKFKIQVSESLNVLQVNGLIAVQKTEQNQCLIKKLNVENTDIEDTHNIHVKSQEYEDAQKPDTEKLVKDLDVNISENYDNGSGTPRNVRKVKYKPSVKKLDKKDVAKCKLPPEVTDEFKCKICGAVLPNIYVYHLHLNQHYPNHICETCGKCFLSEKKLKRHIPAHKTGPFKCDNCDKQFANQNTLNSHRQRKHGTVLLYKCPQCPERFNTFLRRARHLSTAHEQSEGKHECKICKKRFLVAGNLSTHMRAIHLGVKRHHCSQCGMGFFHKEDLRGHVASHTGVKDFQCPMCTKRYPRKKALMVHVRTHTNDKRFCCDVCGKKFLQKCTLMAHLKSHNRPNNKDNGKEVADKTDLNKEILNYV